MSKSDNIWLDYAFSEISESRFFGPTIDESILYLIVLIFPKKFLIKIGMIQEFRESKKFKNNLDQKHSVDKSVLCCLDKGNAKPDLFDWSKGSHEFRKEIDQDMEDNFSVKKLVYNCLAELLTKKDKLEQDLENKKRQSVQKS